MSGLGGWFKPGEHAKLAGARGRRVKGARHANAVMRSQGRIPGTEGAAARRMYARQRRLAKSLDAAADRETGALLDAHATADRLSPTVTDAGQSEY